MLKINTDCRYYVGEKPCVHTRACEGCQEYEPWSGQVLIIKTAAMGDVLRTTSLLPAVKKNFPGHKIVWVAARKSSPLLRGNPLVHEILEIDAGALTALVPRKFDLVVSLDKTPAECGLATMLDAAGRVGIGMSPFGTPYPLNAEAEYYFELGLCDDLKFRKNRKTYHELIREACRLPGGNEPPTLFLTEPERRAAAEILNREGVSAVAKKIGLVAGAGKTFANKAPSSAWWKEFIEIVRKVSARGAAPEMILLGGPADVPEIEEVVRIAGGMPAAAPEDVRVFAAAIGAMDAIVCGDTLALHIATALGRPAIALFGPTCDAEIDLFGRGEKIVTPISCSPCYRGECAESPNCMDTIDPERVARWALSVLQ